MLLWNIRKVISKGNYNYALVPEHPNSSKNGYVLEHRIVVENHLGRLLGVDEVVHHKNEQKKDNRIENLQVMSNADHSRLHALQQEIKLVDLICPSCKIKFTRDFRQTHLGKKRYNYTSCSHSCSGKFSRVIQMYGFIEEVQESISENIVRVYSLQRNSI